MHLDLSGVQIGSGIDALIPVIRNSKSLCVVHLSNNQLRRESRKLLFNLFNQSETETKTANMPVQIGLSIADSF